MRALWLLNHLGAAAMVLAVAAPARAELRISDLDVFLNDQEVTVHIVLLGALPGGLDTVRQVLPTAFNWPLFGAALLLMATPLVHTGWRSLSSRGEVSGSRRFDTALF